jgi:hypothetical protein
MSIILNPKTLLMQNVPGMKHGGEITVGLE